MVRWYLVSAEVYRTHVDVNMDPAFVRKMPIRTGGFSGLYIWQYAYIPTELWHFVKTVAFCDTRAVDIPKLVSLTIRTTIYFL